MRLTINLNKAERFHLKNNEGCIRDCGCEILKDILHKLQKANKGLLKWR